MSQSCRSCKFLEVAPNKAGVINPVNSKAYRCLAPVPPMPDYPDSIASRHDFKHWRNSDKQRVWPEAGTTCLTYEKRVKK